MLGLHVRHPLVLTVAAAAIVVTGFAFAAPHLAPTVLPLGPLERVSLEKVAVKRPLLSVNAPAPTAAPQRSSVAAPEIARKASLSLIVTSVDGALHAAAAIARNGDGDVFSLQSSNDGKADASADMSLRVPAAAFDATLARLVKLGTVQTRSVDAEDLTGNITDSGARLRNLRRTESDILKIMDRSGNVAQVMDAENRLSEVREQIETLESELKAMRGRVAYSSIDLHFDPEAQAPAPDRSAGAQLGNAATAAVHALGDFTLTLLAFAIWIAVFAPYYLGALAVAYLARLLLRKYYAVRR